YLEAAAGGPFDTAQGKPFLRRASVRPAGTSGAPTDVRKAKRRQFVCTALTWPANAAALHRAPGACVDGKKGTSAEEFVAPALRGHIYWRGFAAVGACKGGRPDGSRVRSRGSVRDLRCQDSGRVHRTPETGDSPATAGSC